MPFARENGCVEGDVERKDGTQVVYVQHRLAIDVRCAMAEARDANASIILAAC
jgi:hypothetical protein